MSSSNPADLDAGRRRTPADVEAIHAALARVVQVETRVAGFIRAARAATAFVSDDDMPELARIRVEANGTVLALTSTNRYLAVQATVPCTGHLSARYIHVADLKRMINVLDHTDRYNTLVSFNEQGLTITADRAAGLDRLTATAPGVTAYTLIQYHTNASWWPAVAKTFTTTTDPDKPMYSVGIHPDLLQKIAALGELDNLSPWRIGHRIFPDRDMNRSIMRFELGTWLTVMLMPYRLHDPAPSVPAKNYGAAQDTAFINTTPAKEATAP